MSPDESPDLEQAVSRARERLEELTPLLVMANSLDQQADGILVQEDQQAS